MSRIADHFKRRPFSIRAGRLQPSTGEDSFVDYESVRKLKGVVNASFELPISYRLVFGATGAGKTWAFSWLWREFSVESPPSKCFVIGVPKFEIRKHPERSLVESMLGSALDSSPGLFMLAASSGRTKASTDLRALRDHLNNSLSRQVLIGEDGARVKATEDARAFSMAQSEDLRRILVALLEAILLAGYARCLVLVDELEAPFLLDSKREKMVFSEFLRGVYDTVVEPAPKGPRYPHTVFLFSGTLPVFDEFHPSAVTRQIDAGDVMAAFLRRTEEPFVLLPPTIEELKTIARQEIARSRKKPEKDTLPFSLDAIQLAWEKSIQNLGQFLHIASDMYAIAELDPTANLVTKEHCMQALGAYESPASEAS